MVASGRFITNVLVLCLRSIRDIWFGCSREVGCFLEGLLREVLLYLSIYIYSYLK